MPLDHSPITQLLPGPDAPDFAVRRCFVPVIEFILDALNSDPESVVFVHCVDGVSRSVRYLLFYRQFPLGLDILISIQVFQQIVYA